MAHDVLIGDVPWPDPNRDALDEIKRAIGCPAWTNNDRLVGLVRDIAESINHSYSLNCMLLGPATEQFVLCPTLAKAQEMEAHLESEISKEQEEAR